MDINKGIKFPGPLSILGPYPVDVRSTVENIKERNDLPIEIRYPGMKVFVEETGQEFMYVNNAWVPMDPKTNYLLLDNIMDLVAELSHVLNKPLSISNVIMIDLDSSDVQGDVLKDDGMIFF